MLQFSDPARRWDLSTSVALDPAGHIASRHMLPSRMLPLQMRGVTVTYGEQLALFAVDFTPPSGQISGVVGPNGAGKSTLLRAALGLVPVLAGSSLFFGEPITQVQPRPAYVPQRAAVDWRFPVTALDVVLMGRYEKIGWLRFIRAADRRAAMACLDRVGLADYANNQIGELSGGQQQRVFLARALAQEAQLFMLDEPFSAIDAASERIILRSLRELAAQGSSVICIHHDLANVRHFFDYLLLLNGRTIAEGPVDAVFNGENLQATYDGRLHADHLQELRSDDETG